MSDFAFELLLSTEEIEGLKERFKDQPPTGIGNRLIATIEQRDRAIVRQILKLAEALGLLEEHQMAHGKAEIHKSDQPFDHVAQDWRMRRDELLAQYHGDDDDRS